MDEQSKHHAISSGSQSRQSSRGRAVPVWCAMQTEFAFYGSIPVAVENAKRMKALNREMRSLDCRVRNR